jgi:hypothetical protein
MLLPFLRASTRNLTNRVHLLINRKGQARSTKYPNRVMISPVILEEEEEEVLPRTLRALH